MTIVHIFEDKGVHTQLARIIEDVNGEDGAWLERWADAIVAREERLQQITDDAKQFLNPNIPLHARSTPDQLLIRLIKEL